MIRDDETLDVLRFLYRYCRPHWRRYLGGLLLVPLSIAANLAVPFLTGEATALFESGSWQDSALAGMLGAIIAVTCLRSLTLFGMRLLIIGASRDMELDLRNHIFDHLQSQDQLFFRRARTGDILTRLTSDVERARIIAGPVIMYTASTVLMLAIAVPLMLALSWQLTLLLMLPLCLMTVAVQRIGPLVHERVFRAQEELSALSSSAQENFAGVRVVKAFAQEENEVRRFDTHARVYMTESLEAARLGAWMQPIVGGVNDLAVLAILVVGGLLIVDGQMDFSAFIKFSGYQMQLIWPMISIGWVINQFQRGSASVRRLRDLLAVEPSVTDTASPRQPAGDAPAGSVQIRDLDFSYGGRPILRSVSLDAPAGSTIAIVGRTGSGKSTLVSLVPRLYPVPAGTIFVDGVDVNELPLRVLRRAIGFVPQESFLFSRSLRDNIAFGVDTASEADVAGVAAVTRLDKDVDQFPRGFDEIVGERGVTLSGGQKQRTALARALLMRPRILILDDALSAVDTETEEEILTNLRRFAQGVTTILVSHRISSIKHAERIYVLDEGRVVEEGSHGELLARKGIYAEIYRLQLIEDELERM